MLSDQGFKRDGTGLERDDFLRIIISLYLFGGA
jgi:hypothetical protein